MSVASSNPRTPMRVLSLARIRRCILSVLSAALVCTSGLAAAPPVSPIVSEYAVKAAVLYKITKFVEWPTSSFASDHASLVMCVVGRSAPLPAFESLTGKQIDSHPIDVRLVTGDMLDLRQCHVAFFPADGGADIDYALSKLEGMPVLTVGEVESFPARGGILTLTTRDQRVRFSVNLPASKRSNLTISSQLLNLATVIDGGAR